MVRAIPNIPVQVAQGCIAYTAGTHIVEEDLEIVNFIYSSLGIAKKVDESIIDAVSGVSGFGPAFAYTIMEALVDGAIKNGVPQEMALEFVTQTVLGAAKMISVTGRHPAALRYEICSPGEAAIVGVHELEKGNLRATLINTVEKASQRVAELGLKKK